MNPFADIKAVLFDHDDTLVNTIGTKWALHKHVARTHYGKELSEEEIASHWGKPFAHMVCLLYETEDAGKALALNSEYADRFPKVLFPSTIPLLTYLKEAGKLTGVVTATSRESFEHDLHTLGIPKSLLSYTQTADDTPFHKPDPRVFEPALVWLNENAISHKQVLYVGDGLHDMRAATGAGFQFIGVTTGLITDSTFNEHGARNLSGIGSFLPDSK